ncbi:MAG: hypothetical protein RL733_683, partial [Actinomycetota bacterium]
FGGEHSGHFYFKDFWCADSGMLAALHAIAALLDNQRSLSELMNRFNRYVLSGEINTEVTDTKSAISKVKDYFANLNQDLKFDELDGLSISAPDWSVNLRPSNTEPLLRLNAEAASASEMARVRDLVLQIIRNG